MKRIVILSTGGLALVGIAWAFPLIVGQPVYDGAADVNAGISIGKLINQISLMSQQVTTTENQLLHMKAQAVSIPAQVKRWAVNLVLWQKMIARDTYSLNGGWQYAVNSGGNPLAGYNAIVRQVSGYGTALSSVPLTQQAIVKQNMAFLELTDGTIPHALGAIGAVRNSNDTWRSTMQSLATASISDEPEMNTAAAIANKTNNAMMLNNQMVHADLELRTSQLELASIQAARERQRDADIIATDIEFRTNGAAQLAQHTSGTTQAYKGLLDVLAQQ